jgi:hypothetical protein
MTACGTCGAECGIMAVFGAPAALEDQSLRACLVALDIHTATQTLAGAMAAGFESIEPASGSVNASAHGG